MKLLCLFTLTVCTGLGIAEIVPNPSNIFRAASAQNVRNLGDTLKEFGELIPVDPLFNTLFKYIQNDKEVKDAFDYLWSAEFRSIITSLDSTPQFYKFLNYLNTNGVNVYEMLNQIRDMINVLPLVPPTKTSRNIRRSKRSLNDMVTDMMSIIPQQKITRLFEDKLANDRNFQALINHMRDEKFKILVDIVYQLPEFQSMLEKLRNRQINVDYVINELQDFFNWNV